MKNCDIAIQLSSIVLHFNGIFTMRIRLKFNIWIATFIISAALVSQSCSNQIEVEIIGSFTIAKFDQSEEFSLILNDDSTLMFEAKGFDYENDLAILKYNDGNYQTSTVVPVKNNSLNKYKLSNSAGFPIILNEDKTVATSVNFSGNDYLDEFENLVQWLFKQDTSSADFHFISLEKIMEFAIKTSYSQYAGFQLFSVYHGTMNTHPELSQKIKEFCCGKSGQFYELVCTGRSFEEKVESGECLKHDADTLIFQLSKSTIIGGGSPVGSEIIVLTYWATWCGPCKQMLEYLNSMSKKFYKDKPVFFIAISIDDDVRKCIQYSSEHPEYFSDQPSLMDNGCMKLNYNIESIPQTFIYNKNGKLVATNPSKNEIKNIVDSLLVGMK